MALHDDLHIVASWLEELKKHLINNKYGMIESMALESIINRAWRAYEDYLQEVRKNESQDSEEDNSA